MRPIRQTWLRQRLLIFAAVLCTLCALVSSCEARPTPASSQLAERDSRVAELRRTLLTDLHCETLPEPPLELGIHTACKKFGRGCPDTYVAFLADHVASLQTVPEDTSTNTEERTGEVGAAGTTGSRETTAPPDTFIDAPYSTSPPQPPPTSVPYALRLPMQPEWSYEQFKRLERLIVRIKVAEVQLEKSTGRSSRQVEQQHRIARGENLLLQGDHGGAVSAHLAAVCDSLDKQLSPSDHLAAMADEELAIYETWCIFVRYLREEQSVAVNASASASRSSAAVGFPVPLRPLPSTPAACYAMTARRWYTEVLLLLDPLLRFAVSWTWSVAVPSAAVTAIALWVYVGDGWGEEVEQAVFNAPPPTPSGVASTQVAAESGDEVTVSLQVAEEQHRRSRLTALRYTFMSCALHRSWHMSFLCLRLVLCLAVALDFMWAFAQVVYVTLWPPPAAAASKRHVMAFSLNAVFQLVPPWVRVVVNVYVVAMLQGAVLVMALKGAASAYADWQDFTALCATEQEYLLKAIDDAGRVDE